MKMPKPNRPSLIGVDLGASHVRAVQFDGAGHPLRTLSLPRGEPREPYGADELREVAAIVRRRGFVGKRVVLGAPKSMTPSAMIELPPEDSGAPLTAIARGELARARRIDPSSFELTWWSPRGAGPPARGRVIAVSCEHRAATTVLDAWSDEGFDVLGLCPGPAAVARTHAIDSPEDTEPTIVVDLGWSSCEVIISHNDRVLFQRSVKGAGAASLHAACAEACELDHTHTGWMLGAGREEAPEIASVVSGMLQAYGESASRAIQTTRVYAQECWRQSDFNLVHIAGGFASDSELLDWLQAHVGVICVPISVAGGLDASMATAAGLARADWTRPERADTHRHGRHNGPSDVSSSVDEMEHAA